VTTYFISGHGNVTDDEFREHYEPKILAALDGPDSHFVIGDFRGADTKAQELLYRWACRRVTVYHMFTDPRVNTGDWPTQGGFQTDGERDKAMTLASDEDIAWMRDPDRSSGTKDNLFRRICVRKYGTPKQ
jgi:hypothetical protein